MKVNHRYFLTVGDKPEREVTKAEYDLALAEQLIPGPDTPDVTGRIKTDIEE